MGFHGGGWFSYIAHDPKDKLGVSRELLIRVWHFAKPYVGKISVLLITILLITGLSLLNPLIFRDLIDNALVNKDQTRLNWLALALVAIPILNGLIGVVQRRASSEVGEGIIFDLRRALYEHMQRQSLRFFTQTRTGELMSRMSSDVVGAQSAITSTFVTMISNIVAVTGTLFIMFFLQWQLTLLALAVLPGFIVLARRIGKVVRKLRRRSMVASAEMSSTMNETLNVSGALLVKIFGREMRERERFSRHASEVRDIGIQSAVVTRWFFMGMGIATAIGTALIYWVGGWLVINTETFTVGTIVAFAGYLGQLYGPLSSLTNAPVEFARSMVSFERVFEVLDLPIEIDEKPDAIELPAAAGLIQFENVTFSYAAGEPGLEEVERFRFFGGPGNVKRGKAKDGEELEVERKESAPALTDLNVEIQPGQLVALVGPSGAGKTTFTYMIPRLYDPTEGVVRIDGHDIRDVTLTSLANNIGMVTQETYLFYETVRANLLYANPDATNDEMVAAAKAANIHDFIAGLTDGYDTVVGERGYRLSGGERQRIAIARVILKNPRILVLDEATSSLDSLSEALIQEALERVMAGRTSIVIAHRLSTILAADLILVVDAGQIVEQGTHASLLSQDGLYANLYHTQFVSGHELSN
ncbi:MAG: ATP-binding cassette subfamily B protein [Cellvibrionaceae bacterium]|jgi:ATP-binding cassette subfamily B protein